MSDAAVGQQHQQQHLRAARCISGRQSGREGEADDVKSFKSFRSPLHDMWPPTLCIIHPVYFLTGHHRSSPPPWLTLILPWHKDYYYTTATIRLKLMFGSCYMKRRRAVILLMKKWSAQRMEKFCNAKKKRWDISQLIRLSGHRPAISGIKRPSQRGVTWLPLCKHIMRKLNS